MGNMVEHQIVVGVMEHLSSKDLMMKFGSVSNYLVRMIIFIITVVHERVSDGFDDGYARYLVACLPAPPLLEFTFGAKSSRG